MLPRWLLIAVIAVYSSSWIKSVMAADLLNSMPVASNGWRPIVGSQVKPYATIEQQTQKQTISLTSNDHQEHKNKNEKNKLTANQKGNNGNQVHINHHGSTGHHLLTLHKSKPLAPSKPGSTGGKPAPRHPVLGKLHAHLAHGKRHKPGTPPPPPLPRDEIMAPAPSSAIGSYAYFNQGPITLQNTQLGNNKPYHSPGHVDFSNHFAFSNINNDVVLPQQQYNYQKHPSQNELHPNHYVFINQNDDFTRNLVPPPPIYKPQGEKETLLVKEPQKINEQSIPNHNSQRDEISHIPENVILQLSPSYKQYQHQSIGQPTFDLEITKENFKEYHTTLAPSSYKTSTESFQDATKYTKTRESFTKPSLYGYEVTEEKEWVDQLPAFKAIYPNLKTNEYKNKYPSGIQDNNRFHFAQQSDLTRPSESVQQYSQQDDSPPNQQFLPTPYNPTSAFPTSPTQAEVSTIYSEISQINKKKNAYKVPTTTVYNLKEVATHFPIYSSKNPDTQINIPVNQKEQEYIPEVTTKKEEEETESTLPYSKPTSQTTFPTRGMSWEQRRPSHRRRRPRPTTTTEAVTDDTYSYQSQSPETERPSVKPHRRRRPIKYRTTESPRESTTITESTTRNYRPKPTRAQPQTITEEIFVSKNHRHRPTYQYIQEGGHRNQYENTNTEESANDDNVEYAQNPATEVIRINNHQYEDDGVSETEQPVRLSTKNKRLRPTLTTTTEVQQNTNLNIPENELDYTTISTNDDQSEESVTIKEIYDFENEREDPTTINYASTTSSIPSATTTTTTTEASTTKANRIRQRPIKYDVHRPRFSVKDYRQRLNQYMSTSTTESTKHSTESAPIRIRYPNRLKMSTTSADTDETTEPIRQKYIPKDSRRKYYTTESSDVSSTEKYLRTMNPRLKPFGRYRSTTEPTPSTSSTTQKVAIKSNIFNNLKRPQQLSLRNRIYNKKRNSTTTTTTELYTEEPETIDSLPNTEKTEVTIPFEIAESKIEVTTQLFEPIDDVEILTTTTSTTIPTKVVKIKSNEEVSSPDEAEAFLQLQRISDLTSSAHKQYNTPGMFKSVSPTSRRVPSYFTIATEDPILPIEAFFQI